MPESKLMYAQRKRNIGAFRGCGYSCVYCAFRAPLKRMLCPKCKAFEPHEHLESFSQKPPRTDDGEFVTIGLSGDVAFASDDWFRRAIMYCERWHDRTFMIQSKDPAKLVQWEWPSNVVLGTTLETDLTRFTGMSEYRKYGDISKAPIPLARKEQLRQFAKDNDVAVTIEPILDFNEDTFWYWMVELQPRYVWVGYDSRNYRLPEPELEKTESLIDYLRQNGLTVFTKLMREAWWEHD